MKYKYLLLVSCALLAFTVSTYGGGDWTNFFVPFAGGDLKAAYHPYHLQILLYPFHWLPYYIWSAVTILVLIFTSLKLKTNPLYVLLTLPGVALIWAGQIDAFILVGVYLVLAFQSPFLAGVALILFSVKPHVTWLVGLIVLWIFRHSLLKVLVLPVMFMGLSLLIYGWDWPIRWYASVPTTINSNYGYQSLYLAALLLPLPFLFKDRHRQILLGFCISALLTPVGVYSFTNFLIIYCPIWLVPVTWLIYLLHGFGNVAFIVPIVVLAVQLSPQLIKIIQTQLSRRMGIDLPLP